MWIGDSRVEKVMNMGMWVGEGRKSFELSPREPPAGRAAYSVEKHIYMCEKPSISKDILLRRAFSKTRNRNCYLLNITRFSGPTHLTRPRRIELFYVWKLYHFVKLIVECIWLFNYVIISWIKNSNHAAEIFHPHLFKNIFCTEPLKRCDAVVTI